MMAQASELLAELQRRGVIVAVEGDTLCLKPRRALDNGLLARVRDAKPAILEVLRNRPATCSPDCYQFEAGIWVHRPWTGCTTIIPGAIDSRSKVGMTCWHCRGEKRCTCIACWQAGGPGECVTCKGRGQVWRWVQ
jgi:hypothetical protein